MLGWVEDGWVCHGLWMLVLLYVQHLGSREISLSGFAVLDARYGHYIVAYVSLLVVHTSRGRHSEGEALH